MPSRDDACQQLSVLPHPTLRSNRCAHARRSRALSLSFATLFRSNDFVAAAVSVALSDCNSKS